MRRLTYRHIPNVMPVAHEHMLDSLSAPARLNRPVPLTPLSGRRVGCRLSVKRALEHAVHLVEGRQFFHPCLVDIDVTRGAGSATALS